ncbi:hypothetical protein OAP28_04695 [Planktomarina sp.]|nr:hypothetical protein [Planktomarina sp.]MDA9099987.1 hypothetical protein [Planktomarina sp.]MDC0634391.1 hypothetical protein [Planktomarina sp.]
MDKPDVPVIAGKKPSQDYSHIAHRCELPYVNEGILSNIQK